MTRNLTWRRSTRCASNACVEVATAPGAVHVRDAAAAVVTFTAADWSAFIHHITRTTDQTGTSHHSMTSLNRPH